MAKLLPPRKYYDLEAYRPYVTRADTMLQKESHH